MARVYVIDDDEQLLHMVGLMLQRGGHTPVLINNPVDGLEQIRADKPDVLLLDVMMPNMSGHDLTRQIRNDKALTDLPILILTARSQEIDRATAIESGADGYLSKPVTSQELIEKIDDLLNRQTREDKPLQGIIIGIYGLRGGVGRTSLAVNLAAALRRKSQQEVCLVEWGTAGSQVAIHLRMQPRTSWLDLRDAVPDWDHIQKQMMIHPSGLRVLGGPPLPQALEQPSGELTTAVLQTLRAQMTFTVVDMPVVRNEAFEASLELADMTMHVISPEVVAVQTAVQLKRAFSRANVNLKYNAYIVNQTVPDAQVSAAAIERALGTRPAFQIGYDPNQPRAVAQGVPLTLTSAKTSVPTTVNRMADVILQRVLKREAAS